MTTILEAIKAKDENAEGDTIAKALGGGGTIAAAIVGEPEGDEDETEPNPEPDPEDPKEE